MSGRAPFKQRVAIPLAVIVGTVVGLAGVGYSLMAMKTGGTATTASGGTTSDGGDFVPDPEATEITMYMHVQVLNGTTTAGLARKTADSIAAQGWIISSIGNYSGTKLDKSMVYYPQGFEKQAALLAELVQADTAPADTSMSTKVLTLVVATAAAAATS